MVLVAAELDVLADDSRALHAALTRAGVESSLHVEPGVTHGFINRGRLVPAADASLTRAGQLPGGAHEAGETMKIETVEAKTFRHTSNTVPDSDGTAIPAPRASPPAPC